MFEGLFNHIAALAQNDESVPDEIPCKSGILNIRECDKADKTKLAGLTLDLGECMAQYKVDVTQKLREKIGVAKYLEYTNFLEEKHGKETAEQIVAEPFEELKDIQAQQVLFRLQTNQHPKGAPKTQEDLQKWTHADQVRLEMGEKVWWDSVTVVGSEFGLDSVERLFRVQKEKAEVKAAVDRLWDKLPADKQEAAREALNPKQKEFLNTMESFRDATSGLGV